MATSFSQLPIIDLSELCPGNTTFSDIQVKLSEQLYDVFATTGFAYLVNAPISFNHDDVFALAQQFFALPLEQRMRLAKKTFEPGNSNTYRGYFPAQPLSASDNLKEGFEIGANDTSSTNDDQPFLGQKFNLTEPNVWPDLETFPERAKLEQLHDELHNLSAQLLSLLAVSLDKSPDFFNDYLQDSLSTLRLLHYPPVSQDLATDSSSRSRESSTSSTSQHSSSTSYSHSDPAEDISPIKLSCTPHTDSGILTLLHQDSTGGLEVRNSLGEWVPAPYVLGSIVVNIGDLMAEVSGGRFVATMHRVRAPVAKSDSDPDRGLKERFGRFSVPFFFEPGEKCVVRSVDDDGSGHGILYGEHVRGKMATWVEFQDVQMNEEE